MSPESHVTQIGALLLVANCNCSYDELFDGIPIVSLSRTLHPVLSVLVVSMNEF